MSRQPGSGTVKHAVLTVLATGLMILTAIALMIPFYFMFVSSLKPGEEIMRYGLSLKFDPGISSLANYTALQSYRDGIYWSWYLSSAITMVLQTAIGLLFGSVVGYGLAMYNFKGKGVIFSIVLVLLMIPLKSCCCPCTGCSF